MTYQQLKAKHSKMLNDFEGIFYAFNYRQLDKGMAKLGLDPRTDTDQVASLGSGGYILKTRRKAFSQMLNDFDADMEAMRKDRKTLLEALTYELINHEFCITYDPHDALKTLGLTREDVPGDILKRAMKAAA